MSAPRKKYLGASWLLAVLPNFEPCVIPVIGNLHSTTLELQPNNMLLSQSLAFFTPQHLSCNQTTCCYLSHWHPSLHNTWAATKHVAISVIGILHSTTLELQPNNMLLSQSLASFTLQHLSCNQTTCCYPIHWHISPHNTWAATKQHVAIPVIGILHSTTLELQPNNMLLSQSLASFTPQHLSCNQTTCCYPSHWHPSLHNTWAATKQHVTIPVIGILHSTTLELQQNNMLLSQSLASFTPQHLSCNQTTCCYPSHWHPSLHNTWAATKQHVTIPVIGILHSTTLELQQNNMLLSQSLASFTPQHLSCNQTTCYYPSHWHPSLHNTWAATKQHVTIPAIGNLHSTTLELQPNNMLLSQSLASFTPQHLSCNQTTCCYLSHWQPSLHNTWAATKQHVAIPVIGILHSTTLELQPNNMLLSQSLATFTLQHLSCNKTTCCYPSHWHPSLHNTWAATKQHVAIPVIGILHSTTLELQPNNMLLSQPLASFTPQHLSCNKTTCCYPSHWHPSLHNTWAAAKQHVAIPVIGILHSTTLELQTNNMLLSQSLASFTPQHLSCNQTTCCYPSHWHPSLHNTWAATKQHVAIPVIGILHSTTLELQPNNMLLSQSLASFTPQHLSCNQTTCCYPSHWHPSLYNTWAATKQHVAIPFIGILHSTTLELQPNNMLLSQSLASFTLQHLSCNQTTCCYPSHWHPSLHNTWAATKQHVAIPVIGILHSTTLELQPNNMLLSQSLASFTPQHLSCNQTTCYYPSHWHPSLHNTWAATKQHVTIPVIGILHSTTLELQQNNMLLSQSLASFTPQHLSCNQTTCCYPSHWHPSLHNTWAATKQHVAIPFIGILHSTTLELQPNNMLLSQSLASFTPQHLSCNKTTCCYPSHWHPSLHNTWAATKQHVAIPVIGILHSTTLELQQNNMLLSQSLASFTLQHLSCNKTTCCYPSHWQPSLHNTWAATKQHVAIPVIGILHSTTLELQPNNMLLSQSLASFTPQHLSCNQTTCCSTSHWHPSLYNTWAATKQHVTIPVIGILHSTTLELQPNNMLLS